MLFYLYATGVPLFTFVAWAFSDALQAGKNDEPRGRVALSLLSGALWPVLLLGIAQIAMLRTRAKLIDAQGHGLNGFTAN
ncbi:hypothetical protein ACXDF8_00010 [Mycolicibacterium sp. CBM1]